MAKKDKYTREWIISEGTPIVESYAGNVTIRALHYRLVSIGMPNTLQHYKRVVAAMGVARWSGVIDFDAFRDHERSTIGTTRYGETNPEDEAESSMSSVEFWMDSYRKNRWENQPNYVEVFIEKKALIGVFERPCQRKSVALNPCKGYPSLTYLHDASERYKEAESDGKNLVMLYFGDYDASGVDIPRSLEQNIYDMSGLNIEVKVISLTREQAIEWNLPPAPSKNSDSRTAKFMANGGLGQIELDAVEPKKLAGIVEDAIDVEFDFTIHVDLMKEEKAEAKVYRALMREKVIKFADELEKDNDE